MRISHFTLILLAGCSAGAPPTDPAPGNPLDRLRERTNAYSAFHYQAELVSGKETVAVEMAWRAPDRAMLRFGRYSVVFTGGTARYSDANGACSVDHNAEFARLSKEYGVAPRGGPCSPLFVLGRWENLARRRPPRATIVYGRPGARLAWLDELRTFERVGGLWRQGMVEIELSDEGFIRRAQVGPATLAMKRLVVDGSVADGLFLPPGGDIEAPEASRATLLRVLEDSFQRWVLEDEPDDAALEALVRTGLARRHPTAPMVQVLREGLTKTLDGYRKQNPDAQPELIRAKLELEKGKSLGSVEVMEQEIQEQFERDLDRHLRAMTPVPPADAMKALAGRWRAAVSRQVEAQIRRPFEAVFAGFRE